MGRHSLTQNAILMRPLPVNSNANQIVSWIHQVAPSLVPGGTQSAEDTTLIVAHLISRGVHEEVIATCLVKTSYKWTVPREFMRVVLLVARNQLAREPNIPTTDSMGPRQTYSLFAFKQKAAEFRRMYDANPHNPAVQQQAMQNLVDLLGLAESQGAGEAMPGRGQMATQRDRIVQVQKEILLNAGELGRQVSLQLGPLGMHRARGGFVPRPVVGPVRAPTMTRRAR